MTKLEEKLLELGYKENIFYKSLYQKQTYPYIKCIVLNDKKTIIKRKFIYTHKFEIDLDILEKLSNDIKKDLEVLKEYGINNK